jgi:hypothetical protein
MNMNAIRLLAAGIVKQAMHDRRRARKTLEALPGNENARRMAEDVDSFLASSWFRCLNDISQDMETVIKEELR